MLIDETDCVMPAVTNEAELQLYIYITPSLGAMLATNRNPRWLLIDEVSLP